MIKPPDTLVVRAERWPKGRRGAAELIAQAQIRPKSNAGVFEVEVSYSGNPTRQRALFMLTLPPTMTASNDVWRLIFEALWPIVHTGSNKSNVTTVLEGEARDV